MGRGIEAPDEMGSFEQSLRLIFLALTHQYLLI